jgi:hypothetical protein
MFPTPKKKKKKLSRKIIKMEDNSTSGKRQENTWNPVAYTLASPVAYLAYRPFLWTTMNFYQEEINKQRLKR